MCVYTLCMCVVCACCVKCGELCKLIGTPSTFYLVQRPVSWFAKLVYMQNSKPSWNHQKTPKPKDPPHANTLDPTFHIKVTLCTQVQRLHKGGRKQILSGRTAQDRCASGKRNINHAAHVQKQKGDPAPYLARLTHTVVQQFTNEVVQEKFIEYDFSTIFH